MTIEGFGYPTYRDPSGKLVWEKVCQIVWLGGGMGMASETGVKQMGKEKEIEAPTLARRSLPNKGTGQVGTSRKEWVKRISLKIELIGGVW